MFDAALLWGTRGGAGPEGCDCISTALLAPAMLSDTASCSSGSTQLLCGVGGTLHSPASSVLIMHRLALYSILATVTCCDVHHLTGTPSSPAVADQRTAVAAHLKESVFWTALGGAAAAAAAAGAAGLAGRGALALCLRPSGMENNAMGCSARMRGTSTMK